MRVANVDPALAAALKRRRSQWRDLEGTARLWSRDASLWTGADEDGWLGWLDVERLGRLELLDVDGKRVTTKAATLVERLAAPPFERCLLLGMGGSALGAELLWRALPRQVDAEFIVLDTTAPREIARAVEGVDPAALRVIAASKSGGTIETRLAFELLLDRLGDSASVPRGSPGRRSVGGPRAGTTAGSGSAALVITDPGSALEVRARAAGAPVVFGRPDIGGRFSVLSAFGQAPAAVAGIDVAPLLSSARRMAVACRFSNDSAEMNPGVELGLQLAAAHDCGRDKLYLHAPAGCAEMVAWVEQLLAESLGKGDVLLLPVAAAGLPVAPAPDRLDILLGAGQAPAGAPRTSMEAGLRADLGGEFFRWQFATAVAGALLGVNPFDQPDVESSKIVTRRYVARMKDGDATEPASVVRLSGLSDLGLAQLVGTHLAMFPRRGYAVVSAWMDRSGGNRELLEALRRSVARRTGGSAVLGFGPSYLHSTGQAHKGGPNRGLFLQITADPPADDIPAPGESLTFGQVQLAQAWGDCEVLARRGRRVLAIHIDDGDIEAGLRRLVEAVGQR